VRRWWSVSWRAGLAAVLLASLAAAPIVVAESRSLPRPSHHLARGFKNLDPAYDYTILGRTVSLMRRALEREPDRSALLTRVANDGAALRANGTRPTVTWIGHATLLVQLDGVNILTDPTWSDHAGPLGFGPRRLVPPGLAFEDLPPVHVVLVSHDHYDHHVNPEEGVQLFEDVRGRLLVPMHWGTFALNREPHHEPPERLLAEALRRGLEERIAVLSPGQSIPW